MEPIPPQLQDWLKWAHRFKTDELDTTNDYRNLILRMTDAEILEMGEFYKTAVRENHIQIVKQWLLSHRGEVPMSRDERLIRNLLSLWRWLSNQGCIPFSKGPVLDVGEDCEPTPDWSKVPANFRSLAQAAMMCRRFTYPHSEEGQEYIVETATADERRVLTATAEEVRKIGQKNIREWASGRILYHVEAFLLVNLIAVLEALHLPYYDT
jgi:hypothetical protein